MEGRIAARFEEEAPQLDEGWWSAVLADEEVFRASHKEQSSRAASQPVLGMVDWERVQSIFEGDEVIILQVYGYNRGGLLVQDEGIQGFVPVSHLIDLASSTGDCEKREVLAAYVGRLLHLKVIECEPSQERVVLSERAAQAGQGKRKQLFHSLQAGEAVEGTVTNVTDFGVFIDLGGVEGLIHVSELSWGRVEHPSEVLKVGQVTRALVLQISEENSRVALSLKRLQPNPWETLAHCYKTGDVVQARITSIRRFGAFARLPEGVEGLIHISCVEDAEDLEDLERLFQPGEFATVRILHIDADRRRLGLGLVANE